VAADEGIRAHIRDKFDVPHGAGHALPGHPAEQKITLQQAATACVTPVGTFSSKAVRFENSK